MEIIQLYENAKNILEKQKLLYSRIIQKYTWKTKIIILENNTKIYQEAYFIQADENIKYAISKD